MLGWSFWVSVCLYRVPLFFGFALAYDLFCNLFWLGFGLGLLDSCFFYKPYCCCVWFGLFALLFALFGGVWLWYVLVGLGWLGGGVIVVLRLFKGVLGVE